MPQIYKWVEMFYAEQLYTNAYNVIFIAYV